MEDRIIEITPSGDPTESPMKKNGSNIRGLWDSIKHVVLCIKGIPEGEETEKGIESVFEEIMAEYFPNLKKETDTQT